MGTLGLQWTSVKNSIFSSNGVYHHHQQSSARLGLFLEIRFWPTMEIRQVNISFWMIKTNSKLLVTGAKILWYWRLDAYFIILKEIVTLSLSQPCICSGGGNWLLSKQSFNLYYVIYIPGMDIVLCLLVS